MTNNDVLRRIRYVFDISDARMIKIFGLADLTVNREKISDWLKKDDDPSFEHCNDQQLAAFLNGFIIEKRGKKEEAPQRLPEEHITNNITFMKLKIALDLKSDEVLDILSLAGFQLSKHELSAFFRKTGHKHYRECKDQVLRYFLKGLQLKYRKTDSEEFKWE